jgi:NAD(P)-dependent dehydrogenase (short-subunit alcohol dehydrogenase family)
MARTYVVTGAASGIGLRTKELLEVRGNVVIGVDLKGSDISVDLSTNEGRSEAFDRIEAISDGRIDALIANAGSSAPNAKTISINFFGAVDLIEAAHKLLIKSSNPRVVVTSSMATLLPVDALLIYEMLAGSEGKALARAEELVVNGGGNEQLIYSSSKRALSRWIRRECITDRWAKMGIPMNAVAPGIVKTPMVAELIATESGRAALAKSVPMPLHGYLEAENVAELIIWLASEVNTHVTGQTIYIDGGSDAVIRGEDIWKSSQ